MCDRDDSNLRHFSSRAHQPKHIMSNRSVAKPLPPTNTEINVHLQFDSGFGNNISDNDDMRFRYMGTSPTFSSYNGLKARTNGINCMRSGFNA